MAAHDNHPQIWIDGMHRAAEHEEKMAVAGASEKVLLQINYKIMEVTSLVNACPHSVYFFFTAKIDDGETVSPLNMHPLDNKSPFNLLIIRVSVALIVHGILAEQELGLFVFLNVNAQLIDHLLI